MAHLRYNASKDDVLKSPKQLFSYGMILVVLIMVLLILFYLFPGRTLVNNLLNQEYLSEVDLYYSLLLRSSEDSISMEEIKTNPVQVMKGINQFLNNFHQNKNINNLWFNYIILKVISYGPEFNTDIKQQASKGMCDYFETFKKLPNSDQQLMQLARDALAINKADYALYFYEQILAKNPKQSVSFYENVAKTALWAKACVKSADYYFMTQHLSSSIDKKRHFYLQALKILFQCDQSALAITLAEKNIDGLSDDVETYQALIDYAVKGNQPGMAQKYLFKFLQLKNNATQSN